MKSEKILTFYHFLVPLVVLFLHVRSSPIGMIPFNQRAAICNSEQITQEYNAWPIHETIDETFIIAIVMLLVSIWTTRTSNKFVRLLVPALWIYVAFVSGSRYVWDY